jgi:hypothetical protein
MTDLELPERAEVNGPAGHRPAGFHAWEQPLPPPRRNHDEVAS